MAKGKTTGLNPELLGVSRTPMKSMDVTTSTEKSNVGMYFAESNKQQCIQNKLIKEMLDQLNDCENLAQCINDQLGLPSAGLLTNFTQAVVDAYESHIAEGGADPEFCGEMLACLQSATPAVVDAVAAILNTALATSPNPILSNLCAYINDCIDNGLLAVSADAGNLITTGTDGGAFLDNITATNVTYDNTTSGLTATNVQSAIDELLSGNDIELYEDTTDNGIRYTKANGDVIDLKTSHTEAITPVPNVATTITHNLLTDRVHVEAYDVATGEKVSIQVIKGVGTIDIISTTSDDIEVIIKR